MTPSSTHIQANGAQNGDPLASTVVQFDRDNPPDAVVDLLGAIMASNTVLTQLKDQLVDADAPVDVEAIAYLAGRLQTDATEVEEYANELVSTAKAANGLTVTTETM